MIPMLEAAFPGVSRRQVCQALGISRSWVYARAASAELPEEDLALRAAIEQLVLVHPGYGYRRVTVALQQAGWTVNHKRVARIMREESLRCRGRRHAPTTDSRHGHTRYPNLVRDVRVSGPDQVWVADLTSIRLPTTFVYLACVLDLWSRRCLGWELGPTLETDLALAALDRAIAERAPVPGLIHHSDQGVQYASQRYLGRLQQIGAQISMAAAGRPTDNATMESFFATLKREEVSLRVYQTMAEAEAHLERFLDEVYNHQRLHSRLGYHPPAEFERQHENRERARNLP